MLLGLLSNELITPSETSSVSRLLMCLVDLTARTPYWPGNRLALDLVKVTKALPRILKHRHIDNLVKRDIIYMQAWTAICLMGIRDAMDCAAHQVYPQLRRLSLNPPIYINGFDVGQYDSAEQYVSICLISYTPNFYSDCLLLIR